MRVGFIGTGTFAIQHAKILKEIGVEISACFGTNSEKTETFSKTFNAKIFHNPQQFINKKHIDVLYIVIPPFAHDGIVENLAIANQIPFLCEKPVGLDLNICQKIKERIEKNNLVTSSGFQLRYEKLFDDIKSILLRNELTTARISYYSATPKLLWWRKQECSGGMMIEQACHYIDLLRYLLGEVNTVAAFLTQGLGKKYIDDCTIDDTVETILKFESNIIGSVGITHLLNNIKARKDFLEIYGVNFAMKIDLINLRYNQKAEATFKENHDQEWKLIANKTSRELLLRREEEAFLLAIKKEDPSLVKSSYGDALKTLELTIAINKAARDERIIHLNKDC